MPSTFLGPSSGIIKGTYSGKFDSTVTALGRSSGLLDVQVSKFSAWGLDDADLVRLGVVSGHEISQVLSWYEVVFLRVATSVRQSVGTHLGDCLLR